MSRAKNYKRSRANRKSRACPSSTIEYNSEIESHPDHSTIINSEQMQMRDYDEKWLERIRAQWVCGDWHNLAKLTREEIEFNPDRVMLAMLGAMGRFQTGDIVEGRHYVRLAQDWGGNKKFIIQFLVSGVYNNFGRAYSIIKKYPCALQRFQSAISVCFPESDILSLTQARINIQRSQLGLSPIADISKPIIRIIHHFSCSGGTLITKCLAAQPNAVVLNEVDPFSKASLDRVGVPAFTPRDIISLLHQSGEMIDNTLIADIFCSNMERIIIELSKSQKNLILREHTHSAYLTGASVRNTLSINGVLKDRFNVKSVVTVRNPIDSYLSLQKMGWIHFEPPSFDEYCSRYLRFLKDYNGIKVFRYEDFIENSIDVMANICQELDIEFNANFLNKFSEYKFSGDSGRSGNVIESRMRRPYSQEFANEVNESKNFKKIADILGYDHYLI